MSTKKFTSSSELFKEIKSDVHSHMFPNFLARVGAGVKPYVDAQLAIVAKETADKETPISQVELLRMPPPGRALVGIVFDGDRSTNDDIGPLKNKQQCDAYLNVFSTLYSDRLNSKGKLLQLLAEIGIT